LTDRLTECQFLEGSAICLRVHEVHEQTLESDPAAVDGKVLPVDLAQSNGVDVEVEEARELAEDLLNTDTHGTLGVGEEFNEVGVGERVVTNVIAWREGEEEEQRGNLCRLVLSAGIVGYSEALETDGHGHEAHCHGAGGKHKHPSSAESGDDKGNDNGVHQTPALVGDVDSGFCEGGSVAHHLEKKVLVVREESVAAHLGEDTEEAGNEDTTAHTLGAQHVEPRLFGVLELNLDSRSNLSHLSLDEDRVGIAFRVVLGQDSKSLIVAVFADEPTWALRQTIDEGNLQEGRAHLQQGGYTPTPVTNNVGCTNGNTRRDNCTDKVRSVEQRGEVWTFLWVTEFTDEGRAGDDTENDTDTQKHTGDDIHGEVLREALNESTNHHDQRATHDGRSPAKLLVVPWRNGHGENGTELVAGRDESEDAGLDVGLAGLGVLVPIAKVCIMVLATARSWSFRMFHPKMVAFVRTWSTYIC
jgi:hypothetical protein